MNIAVSIGLQADKDTVATKFFKLYATDYNITDEATNVDSQAMTGNRFGGDDSFVGGISASGSVPVEFNAEALMFLLEGAGFETDEVASPYTFNEGLSVDNYYTVIMENKRDGYYEQVLGAKISQLSLSVSSETYVTGTIDFLGLVPTKVDGAFGGTIVNFDDEPMKCLDMLAKLDTVDSSCKLTTVDLTINNNLEAYKCINGLYNADMQDGTGEITLSLTYNALHKADYLAGFADMIAGTAIAVELTFGQTGHPTTNGTVVMTLPKAKLTSNTAGDYTGVGSLSQDFTVKYDKTAGYIVNTVFTDVVKVVTA